MAAHDGAWAPGTVMCFETLDFLATEDSGLVQVRPATLPSPTAGPDTLIAAVEGPQLGSLEPQPAGDNNLPQLAPLTTSSTSLGFFRGYALAL